MLAEVLLGDYLKRKKGTKGGQLSFALQPTEKGKLRFRSDHWFLVLAGVAFFGLSKRFLKVIT